MTILSTTNIHHVVSATVESKTFPDFVSTQFTFTTADGSVVEISAFSSEPLTIATLPARVIEQPKVPA